MSSKQQNTSSLRFRGEEHRQDTNNSGEGEHYVMEHPKTSKDCQILPSGEIFDIDPPKQAFNVSHHHHHQQ